MKMTEANNELPLVGLWFFWGGSRWLNTHSPLSPYSVNHHQIQPTKMALTTLSFTVRPSTSCNTEQWNILNHHTKPKICVTFHAFYCINRKIVLYWCLEPAVHCAALLGWRLHYELGHKATEVTSHQLYPSLCVSAYHCVLGFCILSAHVMPTWHYMNQCHAMLVLADSANQPSVDRLCWMGWV